MQGQEIVQSERPLQHAKPCAADSRSVLVLRHESSREEKHLKKKNI